MAAPANRFSSRTTARRAKAVAMAAVAAIALAACSGGNDGEATIRLSAESPDLSPSAGQVASDGSAASVGHLGFATLDGDEHALSRFSGHPLVINFFAVTCPACVAEMPDFEKVFQDVRADVSFLGVSQDVLASDAAALVERTGVTYEIGWDPDLELYIELGGFGPMPMTVFIDADGVVAEVWSGVLTADALREKIEAVRT